MNIPPLSPVINKTLGQINLPRRCTLALIIRGEESITPNSDTILREGDEIYALVTREGEAELRNTFGAN